MRLKALRAVARSDPSLKHDVGRHRVVARSHGGVEEDPVADAHPGGVGTDMVKATRPDVLDKIIAGIPVKRLGTPADIASMVSWVASDESGFATGADFSVNGGLHMGKQCGRTQNGFSELRHKNPEPSGRCW